MRDKFTDTIRIGIVSSINPEKGTAKITFPDRHDIVSRDLPVVVPCTLEDKWYYMPDVGERVRVLFDPEAPTRGCILGSYYDDKRIPPVGDKNKAYVKFKDETLIEYDRELHKLTIHIVAAGEKSIEIKAESDISVQTNGKLVVEVAKDVDLLSVQNINIVALQDINISVASGININAESPINITSSNPINIKSNDHVSISGATTTTVVS